MEKKNNTEALNLILDHLNADDLNAISPKGDPLIFIALENIDLEAIILLINKGANVEAKKNTGSNLLDHAKFLMKAHNDHYDKPDRKAIIGKLDSIIDYLKTLNKPATTRHKDGPIGVGSRTRFDDDDDDDNPSSWNRLGGKKKQISMKKVNKKTIKKTAVNKKPLTKKNVNRKTKTIRRRSPNKTKKK